MRFIVLLTALVLISRDAHAYLDPGTGSMLLQGLLAGLLAVGAFWRNIKSYIRNLLSKNEPEQKEQ